ncbi:MAG: metal ABC transporter solute-binding protein [Sporolactobacillus sp.]
MKRFRWIHFSFMIVLAFVVVLSGALAGCSKPQSGAGSRSKINVVAAEDFYGEVVEAVGGKYVSVTSIINKPSMDPHDYEPTSQTARAVSGAKLIVYNGIGYDGWMDKLLTNNKNSKNALRVGEDLLHKKDGANEHLWYQPKTMPKLATALASKFSKIDPKHAAYFNKNAVKFKKEIQPVQDEVKKLSMKSNGKLVDVSEPIFDYTLKALGYKVANNHFELAVEHETDPSPTDIAGMQKDVKNHKIAFFVSNIQEISPTVKKIVALADKNHLPVVKVTETLPKGKNYKTWMMDELKQVEAIQNK